MRDEGWCELKQGWMRTDGLIVVVFLVLIISYSTINS